MRPRSTLSYSVSCTPGLQKDFLLQHYGDRFAQGGFASFIFDYRTFGGSDGEPRNWVSPTRHLQDYESAVVFVKQELGDRVDINRINLWGLSLSAGHVLTLAGTSLRDNITSVVAQVNQPHGFNRVQQNSKGFQVAVLLVRAYCAASCPMLFLSCRCCMCAASCPMCFCLSRAKCHACASAPVPFPKLLCTMSVGVPVPGAIH